MAARLTKPLVVPEYSTGAIKLYTPDPTTGVPTVNAAYTVDTTAILATLLPGQGRIGAPNCCLFNGVDLFVALSSSNAQAVVKLPGYLADPATAKAHAFFITLAGNDYVGLAFDAAGFLYVAEGSYGNNAIVRYAGANAPYPGADKASGDNNTGKVTVGNAGMTSYFGNLAFDSKGNLWVADYLNHRVVAFDAAGLGTANSYHVLAHPTGSFAVANTVAGLNAPTTALFAEPEGLDFDSFAATANLWVANNNDGGGSGGVKTTLTSLVKITPALQTAVLATANAATIAAAQITPNTNCFIYQMPNGAAQPQFGGLQVDKAANRLYVNDETNADGRAYDLASIAATPSTPTDSQLGIATTNPGNGGIALLQLGAFVADSTADKGLEPDVVTAVAWECLTISLTQANGGALATLPAAEEVKGGQPCYLYVLVQNFGARPTLGIETLDLLWAKASAGLAWPAPWDGTVFDAAPDQTSVMGGTIASATPIPIIAGFGSAVVGPITWSSAPDPSKYTVQDGHFCLLARIVTPGLGAAGMSVPETSGIIANTLANARIAWRNIHIINPVTNKLVNGGGVILANYTGTAMTARLAFEILNADGRLIAKPPGRLTIDATGASRAALARSSLRDVLRGEGPVALTDIEAGIGDIRLAPDERITITADYRPPAEGAAFALRVRQFVEAAGSDQLIGGQTFVKGQVAGFPIKPTAPVPPPPPAPAPAPPAPPKAGGIPVWIWWLLLAIVIVIILRFIL